jgi:hypothetical protein
MILRAGGIRQAGVWLGLLTLSLSLSLGGCQDPREPLDLDAITEPGRECVEVIHESLELGGPVHHFVSDDPGSAGGWGLITSTEGGGEHLVIVRLGADDGEAAIAPIPLGLPPSDVDLVRLRAGADPGELWVLTAPGSAVTLRRLLPELGEVERNDALANFPADDGSSGGGCPSEFARELLLIEGKPYLLALPNCSDDPALVLHLLELERDTLLYETSWELVFDPCAGFDDPAVCAQIYAYSLAGIGLGSSSALPDQSRVQFGFTQVRAYTGGLSLGSTVLSSDVSLLDMRLTPEGPNARMVTFREVWVHSFPIILSRVMLAQDPYSSLLHVRNVLVGDDAALLRFDTIGDYYVLLRTPELLPFGGRGQLVQLGNQGAMIDVDVGSGELRAAALIDIASWPTWTEQTLLQLDGLVSVEPSGVGQLLLRREELPPQVVRVSCLEPAK